MMIVVKEGQLSLIKKVDEENDIYIWLWQRNSYYLKTEYLSYWFGRYDIETMTHKFWDLFYFTLLQFVLYSLFCYFTCGNVTILGNIIINIIEGVINLVSYLTQPRAFQNISKTQEEVASSQSQKKKHMKLQL